MSRYRLALVYFLIAVLVGGNLFDAVFKKEHWPFSNYPMFSTLATSTLTRYELTCLTSDADGNEREAPLDWHAIPSLPPYKFDGQLRHFTVGKPDALKLQKMLSDYIAAYESRRKLGLHHGPIIHGLRIYKVEIPLEIPLRPGTFTDGDRPEHADLVLEYNESKAIPLFVPDPALMKTPPL